MGKKKIEEEPLKDAEATEEVEVENEDLGEEPSEKTEETEEVEEASGESTEAASSDSGREMWKIKCSECGKDAEVPFKPTEGRAVYCRDCFSKQRRSSFGGGGGNRFGGGGNRFGGGGYRRRF